MTVPISLNEYKLLEERAENAETTISKFYTSALDDKRMFIEMSKRCKVYNEHIPAYRSIAVKLSPDAEYVLKMLCKRHCHTMLKMLRLLILQPVLQNEYVLLRWLK